MHNMVIEDKHRYMDRYEIVESSITSSVITPEASMSSIAILECETAIHVSLIHDQLQR
jgi:hypothetical protein